MNRLLVLLICILVIASSAAAADPNSTPAVQQPSEAVVTITADNLSGSGFNVASNGIVITSFTVIKNARKIKVKFGNGDIYEVQKVYNFDRDKDICLLTLPGFDLPKVTLGNSNPVKNGDKVTAPGIPGSKDNPAVSGIVTGNKTKDGLVLFQTTLPIIPGAAGGPLFNDRGEVIGVITAAWTDQESQRGSLVIPINYARGLLQTNKDLDLNVLSDKYSSPSPVAAVASPPDDIKKLIPAGTILIDTRTDEVLPFVDNSLRQLLAKNKIGATLSSTLQDSYVKSMKRKIMPDTPENAGTGGLYMSESAETRQRFMTQCAQEIGGYLLSVRINYSGQDYTVFIEYELIDPANSVIICSNSLKDHYGWWSWRRDSETAMVDNSLKRMVKDLRNQLKRQKSVLIHK